MKSSEDIFDERYIKPKPTGVGTASALDTKIKIDVEKYGISKPVRETKTLRISHE